MMMLFLFLTSCKTFVSKSHKKNFSHQFFTNSIVCSTLQDYYGDNILIYDSNKVLEKSTKHFSKDSVNIVIQNFEPQTKDFFRVHDFTLNQDLAMIVLSTEDRKKGVLFYLRLNKKKNIWEIMELTKRSSK